VSVFDATDMTVGRKAWAASVIETYAATSRSNSAWSHFLTGSGEP
jgi:hypothetical protein